MRPVRRPSIPQRRRVFLGCEGESERSYANLLVRLLEQSPPRIHLDAVPLGGGDPLALVERAMRHIANQDAYVIRAVLLDADRLSQTPDRDDRMRKIAETAKLRLIWQTPCHEALLLRHLENCGDLRPPTSDQAERQLRLHWPDYKKGLSAIKLAQRIGVAEVRQILPIELDLAAFLREIGFA
jgi:RloB-like protein